MIRHFLAACVLLAFAGSSTLRAGCFPQAGGFNLGATQTPEANIDNPGWTGSGSLECFGDRLLQPRALFGIANLRGNDSVQEADATYLFATGGIVFGRLIYGTLSAGLYEVSVHEPLVSDSTHDLAFGYNGGIRFLLPMGHNAGLPVEVLYHRTNATAPDNFWTFTVGLFFW